MYKRQDGRGEYRHEKNDIFPFIVLSANGRAMMDFQTTTSAIGMLYASKMMNEQFRIPRRLPDRQRHYAVGPVKRVAMRSTRRMGILLVRLGYKMIKIGTVPLPSDEQVA